MNLPISRLVRLRLLSKSRNAICKSSWSLSVAGARDRDCDCNCNLNLIQAPPTTTDFAKRRPCLTFYRSKSTRDTSLGAMAGTGNKLDSVPDVDIDNGRFKYILIKIYDNSTGKEITKTIVRGYNFAAYHADIYEQVDGKLQQAGIESECIGGGRILHELDKKAIKVYGYSTGYGKADHEITTEILKKKYPDYTITWSNEE